MAISKNSMSLLNFILPQKPPGSNAATSWIASPTSATGTSGNDQFDVAGTGVWAGGGGDDTYIVGSASVVIDEKPNDGIDTIITWLNSYALPANVENLTEVGAADATLHGNALNNIVIGNSGNNIIDGGAGDDWLTGGGGRDKFIISNGGGIDTITDFSSNDTLQINNFGYTSFNQLKLLMKQIKSDVVIAFSATQGVVLKNTTIASLNATQFQFSNPNASTPTSSSGKSATAMLAAPTSSAQAVMTAVAAPTLSTVYFNYLGVGMPISSPTSQNYWGNGVDSTLTGTAGGDTFHIYSLADKVIEAAGGISTVIATFYKPTAYVLPTNVNNLTITGTNVTGIGDASANLMIAQGAGNVTLDGRGGNDVLAGGQGADTFIFAANYGQQVIYNFNVATDKIRLENFGNLTFNTVKADASQVGQDLKITLSPTDSIILRGMTVAQLTASDFELPINTSSLRMTFDDEFNSFTSSPDGGKGWMTSFPYSGAASRSLPSNGEVQYYSDSSVGVNPFRVSNGVLSITAAPATPGVGTPVGSGLTYTSGLATTYHSFSQLYGYFEVRAELPTGSGFWPAFWMLPANNTWPPELDVMEQFGGDPSTIYSTAHTNVGGYNTQTQSITSQTGSTSGFHTYGVDWEADKITWYEDGDAVAEMVTPSDMNTPMYMLLDLAVGGSNSWAGAADGVSSATMQVDYVRVYAPTEVHAAATRADAYTANAGHSVSIAANAGVLANDLDQNAQTLTSSLANGPAHGTLVLNADGSFIYTPTSGFAGSDSFTYYADDSSSRSVATTVGVAVTAHAPVASADTYNGTSGKSLSIAIASGVLANDVDKNGLGLSAALAPGGGPSHGTLSLNANGSFTYTSAPGYVGADHFSYIASDSLSHSAVTTATLNLVAAASSSSI